MTEAGGKMAQIQEVIHKLRYAGAVDADGHILESAKCWEENCESKYRANALRLREDQGWASVLRDQRQAVASEPRGELRRDRPDGRGNTREGKFRPAHQVW